MIITTETLSQLNRMTISAIAEVIKADHRNNKKQMYFGAVPYVQAMQSMTSINDAYGADSGKSIVVYALSNLSTWRGDVARAVKKELNARLKK